MSSKAAVDRRLTFASSLGGQRATDEAGCSRGPHQGPYHPETVADALRPPDNRFYGGAKDAVAILQALLDAALAEADRSEP